MRLDVHQIKHGLGVSGTDYDGEMVLETFTRWCPLCGIVSEHRKILSVLNGKPSTFQQCWLCRGHHSTRRPQDQLSSLDSHSISVANVCEHVWQWFGKHIQEIVSVNPGPQIHKKAGILGSPRRNKGKPAYDVESFHPEFIRYLETPQAIKAAHQMMDELFERDRQLYSFIYLKAIGYSYSQIEQAMGIRLLTPPKKKRVGHGGAYQANDRAREWNRKAVSIILDTLPESLIQYWGISKARDAIHLPNSKQRADQQRKERVVCPKCNNEKSIEQLCDLCRDGFVPRCIAKAYRQAMEEGREWIPFEKKLDEE